MPTLHLRRPFAPLLFLLVPFLATAAEPDRAAEGYAPLYAELLSRHTRVVEGTVGVVVDYSALLREPAATQWSLLLDRLSEARASSRDEKLALYLNAYNILAIDVVLRHYPVASIRDAGTPFLNPVWKLEAGTVAGRELTLHEIEHEILRKLGEPRIHASIVCASTSCPSLRREPFDAATLDAQLDDSMRRWLASPEKGLAIDRSAGRIRVSKIFDWFADDFEAAGGIVATLRAFAPEVDRDWLRNHGEDAGIEYFSYDWSLNDADCNNVACVPASD